MATAASGLGYSRPMRFTFAVLLWLSGCDGSPMTVDAPTADAGGDASTPPPLEGVAARLYDDVGEDDRTRRVNGIGAEDVPRSGVVVRLLGNGTSAMATTGADGVARFEGVAPGRYLFAPAVDGSTATTHNVASAVAAAIDRGTLNVTTLGDSLPVDGGTPTFDEVLTELLEGIVPVNAVDVADPGSTTRDWTAGSANDRALQPHVEGTDLFVISLGGNDLLSYLSGLSFSGPDDIGPALEMARTEARAITERVIELITRLRAVNPDADFAYLVYPAYADSTAWQSLIGAFVDAGLVDTAINVIRNTLRDTIRDITTRFSEEDVILADIYQLSRAEPIDPLLFDELHFTTYGHQRVGEEFFLSLGGIEVGGADALVQPYEVGIR